MALKIGFNFLQVIQSADNLVPFPRLFAITEALLQFQLQSQCEEAAKNVPADRRVAFMVPEFCTS